MRKTRFIALALAVAVMLMGAGYALWSDKTVVTTTVKTGNFNMDITSASIRTGDMELANERMGWHWYDWTHGDYHRDVKISDNKKSVVIEARDLYPGGAFRFDMRVKNNGTIPAKIKSIDVEKLYESKEGLFDLMGAKYTWNIDVDSDGNYDHLHFGGGNNWRSIQNSMNHLVASASNMNLVIEPGDSIGFGSEDEPGCIEFKLDPSAGNEYQNQRCVFKITFNWEQWASDPAANPYPYYGNYGDGDITGIVQ